MLRTLPLFVVLALAVACAGRGDAPKRDPVAEVEALARARPDDGSLRYVLALLEERAGRPERALARLGELLPLTWDYALDDADFPRASALPGYREVAATLERREPKVVRGEVVRVLDVPEIRPEGIAWDPALRAFYLGHAPGRGVMIAPIEGEVRPLAVPGPGDMLVPLGMKVDAAARVLWVASIAMPMMAGYTAADEGRSRLVAVDLRSGAARASLALGGPGAPSGLNDVALLPGGRVVATDTISGALYAADLEAEALRVLTPAGALESPNGIAAAADGSVIYVADLFGLSAVDPASGAVRRFAAPAGACLGGVDGLSFEAGRLIGIQNLFGMPRIWSVAAEPSAPGTPVIVASGDRRLAGPTTGAVVDGALWLIANPQLRTTDADGKPWPRERLDDLELMRIPL